MRMVVAAIRRHRTRLARGLGIDRSMMMSLAMIRVGMAVHFAVFGVTRSLVTRSLFTCLFTKPDLITERATDNLRALNAGQGLYDRDRRRGVHEVLLADREHRTG